MRRASLLAAGFALCGALALSLGKEPDDEAEASGRKAVQTSCIPCHSLRLIESQRLSAAAWQKEVDKMIGWGAVVPNRQIIIEYLSRHYGKAQPASIPARSVESK